MQRIIGVSGVVALYKFTFYLRTYLGLLLISWRPETISTETFIVVLHNNAVLPEEVSH